MRQSRSHAFQTRSCLPSAFGHGACTPDGVKKLWTRHNSPRIDYKATLDDNKPTTPIRWLNETRAFQDELTPGITSTASRLLHSAVVCRRPCIRSEYMEALRCIGSTLIKRKAKRFADDIAQAASIKKLKAEAEHRAKVACGVKRQAFRASVAARPPKMGKFVVDNMGRRVD